MSSVEFFVPGRPAPQGSKRHVGNGILVESSKAVKPWRIDIAWCARAHHDGPMWCGCPVAIGLDFVLPRPKSTPKRRTPAAIKRPDLDKLTRSVLDALKDVIYQDDSQIVEILCRKRLAEIGEATGLHVQVRSL